MINNNWVHWSWQLPLVSVLICWGDRARAQLNLTPDTEPSRNLGTEVDPVTPQIDLIVGGTRPQNGSNLFHSFAEFNIPINRAVYFDNPVGVENILSRVTGSDPSDILGTLGVVGNANLFLINPNGIIFGSDATLDVGGSFVATTANAVGLSEIGIFSASQPQTSNLLSIKPSAFFFNALSSQGTIVNRSTATSTVLGRALNGEPFRSIQGLNVLEGKNLLLVGGNVRLEGGRLQARGGRIELGGLSEIGTVGLDIESSIQSLAFPQGIQRADVSLTNQAAINVAGNNSGSITFNAQNIDILQESYLLAGIRSGLNLVESQAGDVTLNATEAIKLDQSSFIGNNVYPNATGNSGNIVIRGESLSVTRGSLIDSSTYGQGDSGKVDINVSKAVNIGGVDGSTTSAIYSSVLLPNARGNSNGIFIKAGTLSVTDGAELNVGTYGQGNAGIVDIDVREQATVSGRNNQLSSRILSIVDNNGVGKSGEIRIRAKSFELSNSARLNAGNILGQADAGKIDISVNDSVLLNNGEIVSQSQNQGGDIKIRSESKVLLTNNSLLEVTSGSGGNIAIATRNLDVLGRSQLRSGIGVNLGSPESLAGDVLIDGIDSTGAINISSSSTIQNRVNLGGFGSSGAVTIKNARLLSLTDSSILVDTLGNGKAGNVEINVVDAVNISNTRPLNLFSTQSGIFTLALSSPNLPQGGDRGQASNVRITANSLSLTNGGQINTKTVGRGDAGNVDINVKDNIFINGINNGVPSQITSAVELGGTGKGGDINIIADSLSVANGALVSASTTGQGGDAGNIQINTANNINISGIETGILTSTNSDRGKGGTITIDTNTFRMTDSAAINAVTTARQPSGNIIVKTNTFDARGGSQLFTGTVGAGDAGNIFIQASDAVLFDGIAADGLSTGALSAVETTGTGKGGNVTIDAGSLSLTNGAQLQAQTRGQGDSGNVVINTRGSVLLSGQSTGIITSVQAGAVGNVGDIRIQSQSLDVLGGSQVQAIFYRQEGDTPGGRVSSQQQKRGVIQIDTTDYTNLSGFSANGFSSGLFTSTERGASGGGGNTTVNTPVFRVADGAVVNAQTLNSSDGGNVIINANTFEAVNGGQVLTVTRNTGNAGSVTINAKDSITISGSDPSFNQRFTQFGRDVVNNEGSASGVFANTDVNSTGNGGPIFLSTGVLNLTNGAQISARSQGTGKAGDITVNARQTLNANNSDITTSAAKSSGGEIRINAKDVRLQGDSDIRTDVASGENQGGNITIIADSIIAFDDSDILAFARDGRGGNITLNTPAFFGSGYQAAQQGTNLEGLDGNNRVDVNATGAIASGNIFAPDTSSVQNNLSELSPTPIDTNALIADSCIARNYEQEGSFTITGSGGLPNRPGNASVSSYPTGDVRSVQGDNSVSRSWLHGDPIIEPQGVYQLPDGRLVLSRECPN